MLWRPRVAKTNPSLMGQAHGSLHFLVHATSDSFSCDPSPVRFYKRVAPMPPTPLNGIYRELYRKCSVRGPETPKIVFYLLNCVFEVRDLFHDVWSEIPCILALVLPEMHLPRPLSGNFSFLGGLGFLRVRPFSKKLIPYATSGQTDMWKMIPWRYSLYEVFINKFTLY